MIIHVYASYLNDYPCTFPEKPSNLLSWETTNVVLFSKGLERDRSHFITKSRDYTEMRVASYTVLRKACQR